MKRITKREELVTLAAELGTRPDWHEPDEQDLTARVFGDGFDNAGFWDDGGRSRYSFYGTEELHVVLYRNETPVASVNLATLFAWAAEQRGMRSSRVEIALGAVVTHRDRINDALGYEFVGEYIDPLLER